MFVNMIMTHRRYARVAPPSLCMVAGPLEGGRMMHGVCVCILCVCVAVCVSTERTGGCWDENRILRTASSQIMFDIIISD